MASPVSNNKGKAVLKEVAVVEDVMPPPAVFVQGHGTSVPLEVGSTSSAPDRAPMEGAPTEVGHPAMAAPVIHPRSMSHQLNKAPIFQVRSIMKNCIAALVNGNIVGANSALACEQDSFLSRAAELLTQEVVRLDVPFVFNVVRSHIDRFSGSDIAALGIEHGQALVISSTLQLHRLIADVITTTNTATQHQEAHHNGLSLWNRVNNAFGYYSVLFNDLEVCGVLPESANRRAIERLVLREEIMDIVARDGAARRERHEKVVRWVPRMLHCGFKLAPASMDGFMETTKLVDRLSDNDKLKPHYRVQKENGFFFVYSSSTPMFSVSVWKPAGNQG
ncbi:hypothetical protein BAE44_0004740 [Dichanthelium oligosanthes]|uniref:Uncharacterized protein n=1 Tax=Dichanthelium oligosanthes TaxID=888268 RepID=A0A1E5WA07_9POAL|nr:hypothetical protein BAE44_0004740 [Dichanthelium oligosanthes]